mmetsp:Transcript_60138/g.159836  ORF Transcript_60138/g.159836 Transcript_60138/m.159836 type:complete len:83 (-) Transcript_60138:1179-1427(-)
MFKLLDLNCYYVSVDVSKQIVSFQDISNSFKSLKYTHDQKENDQICVFCFVLELLSLLKSQMRNRKCFLLSPICRFLPAILQ